MRSRSFTALVIARGCFYTRCAGKTRMGSVFKFLRVMPGRWSMFSLHILLVLYSRGKRAYATGNMHTPQACIRQFLRASGFRKIFGHRACRHLLDTDKHAGVHDDQRTNGRARETDRRSTSKRYDCISSKQTQTTGEHHW